MIFDHWFWILQTIFGLFFSSRPVVFLILWAWWFGVDFHLLFVNSWFWISSIFMCLDQIHWFSISWDTKHEILWDEMKNTWKCPKIMKIHENWKTRAKIFNSDFFGSAFVFFRCNISKKCLCLMRHEIHYLMVYEQPGSAHHDPPTGSKWSPENRENHLQQLKILWENRPCSGYVQYDLQFWWFIDSLIFMKFHDFWFINFYQFWWSILHDFGSDLMMLDDFLTRVLYYYILYYILIIVCEISVMLDDFHQLSWFSHTRLILLYIILYILYYYIINYWFIDFPCSSLWIVMESSFDLACFGLFWWTVMILDFD